MKIEERIFYELIWKIIESKVIFKGSPKNYYSICFFNSSDEQEWIYRMKKVFFNIILKLAY